MKKLLLSFTALVLTVCAFAQKKADDVAKFVTETIDLGNITQNVPATATFEVTNISKEPLLIETANPTCGCTISDFTKTPIEPGKVGTIKATYNAKNLNAFEKHLTVKFAGTDDLKSITIKGNVVAAEAPAPAGDKADAGVEKKQEILKEEIVSEPQKEAEAKKAAAAKGATNNKVNAKQSGNIKNTENNKANTNKKPQ